MDKSHAQYAELFNRYPDAESMKDMFMKVTQFVKLRKNNLRGLCYLIAIMYQPVKMEDFGITVKEYRKALKKFNVAHAWGMNTFDLKIRRLTTSEKLQRFGDTDDTFIFVANFIDANKIFTNYQTETLVDFIRYITGKPTKKVTTTTIKNLINKYKYDVDVHEKIELLREMYIDRFDDDLCI